MDVEALAELLHETEEHHSSFETVAPPHDWWDWYAAYIAARERGSTTKEASAAAGRYMAAVKHVLVRPATPGAETPTNNGSGGTVTNAAVSVPTQRALNLLGQTVVVIGGSAGIGLETARLARTEGAEVILTAREPDRLKKATHDLGALSSAAFDASDPDSLARFFDSLSGPIDHVMVGGGGPRYGRPLEMDPEEARRAFSERAVLVLAVAQNAVGKMRPGGSLVLVGGTGGRRITPGYEIVSAVTAAMPALTASLALDLAPIRVNLLAPGFVDTPMSARLLGDGLEARRAELRTTLPIGRVVEPADVAALAVHLMVNTAVTGATYDIDGGQQFVA